MAAAKEKSFAKTAAIQLVAGGSAGNVSIINKFYSTTEILGKIINFY